VEEDLSRRSGAANIGFNRILPVWPPGAEGALREEEVQLVILRDGRAAYSGKHPPEVSQQGKGGICEGGRGGWCRERTFRQLGLCRAYAPDEGTPVADTYNVPFKFTGTINKVTIEVKAMKAADTGEAEQSRKEAALKKGLSE
jgi:hypothetical protein